MTRLLVSVRNAAEAAIALRAGADLIDVKEPLRGALGAADASILADVLAVVGGQVPVSAALGEVLPFAASLSPQLAAGLRYFKFGLAGCGAIADWADRWHAAWRDRGRADQAVAVIYADWQTARRPVQRTYCTSRRVWAWGPCFWTRSIRLRDGCWIYGAAVIYGKSSETLTTQVSRWRRPAACR